MAEIPFPGGATDGTTFFHEDKVCVYHEATNTWECRAVSSETPTPPQNIYTTDVLVPDLTSLPDQGQLNLRGSYDELGGRAGRAIQTQADINQETVWTFFNQRRKQSRTSTRTDFIQNTVIDDEWEYDAAGQAAELPEQGKFHLFDSNNQPNSHWKDVAHISINGTGRNTQSLADIRRGSVIQIQDVLVNSFAQYVATKVEFIGSVEGGQFFVEIDVKAAYNRAVGVVPDGSVCEIQVISSHPCITTPADEPPLVDDDGFLWFNEARRQLYVSRWDDVNNTPNGHALWIAVDRSQVIQTVTYYDGPEFFDDVDGAIAGAGTEWYLSPQAQFLESGDFIEIGDQPAQVLTVEQKDDQAIAYTAITLDREVEPPVANGELTHLHKPIKAGDNLDTAVEISENPPSLAPNGALWFCSKEDDATLYVNIGTADDPKWVSASPPVSLDGIKGDIANIDATVTQVRANLFEVDNDVKAAQLDIGELKEAVDDGTREQTQLRSRIGDVENGLTKKLNLTGGKLTGNLSFASNTRIDCNAGQTVLHGRGCFELRAGADHPVIFSSGSGSKKLLSFYGYDGSQPDNKAEKAYITAGGEARFKKVFDDGKRVATQEYVNNAIADVETPLTGDLTWRWHHPAENKVGNGSIYFYTNDIGSVTTIRIATESMDGRKIDVNNFSYSDKWKLPFTIYTEDENGMKIIAAGVSSHAECKVFSGVQTISIEFTNSKDMMNWRRDSIPTETPVKVKIAGLIP